MKYDWENNAESWLKAMHTRKRFLRLHVGGSLLFVFVVLPILAWTASFLKSSFTLNKMPIFWFFLAGITLLGAAVSLFQLVRHRFVSERIPLHNARVCPKCYAALDQEGETNPEENTTLAVQCPSCSESLVLTEVEDYWSIYPGQMGLFQSWRTNLNWYSYQGNYDPNQPLALAFYLKPRTYLIIAISLICLYLAGMSLFYPGSVLVGLVNHSAFVLFALPFIFFQIVLSRRKARSIHCHKCHYEKAPGASDRCSECGEDWSWPFQRRRGQKISGRNKSISTALYLAMFVFPLLLLWSGLGVYATRIMPTTSLITQITNGRSFISDEWDVINQRTLVPDETRTLFLGLLEKRRDQHLFGDARNWLETQIKTGSVSQILIDRYYRESIRFNSHFPTFAALHETINLTFEISDDFIFQWNAANHLLLEHIEINGQPVPNSRPDKPFSPHRLTGPQISKSRNYPCPIPLTLPDQPGPVHIKLIYWQIIAPMKPGIPTAQWNDDNTPILPSKTIWSDRIEQEFTITLK